jgi:hypothetical protein
MRAGEVDADICSLAQYWQSHEKAPREEKDFC